MSDKNKRSNSPCAHTAKRKCSPLNTSATTMSFTSGTAGVTSCLERRSKGGNMPEVKPGRWRMRSGETAIVKERKGNCSGYPWFGIDSDGCGINWQETGLWLAWGQSMFDLIEYLGPEEPAGAA